MHHRIRSAVVLLILFLSSPALHGENRDWNEPDRVAQIRSDVLPYYPEKARLAGIAGKVFVKVLVNKNGIAEEALIVKRVPEEIHIFDDSALNWAMSTEYAPAIKDGKPLKSWLTIPVLYRYD